MKKKLLPLLLILMSALALAVPAYAAGELEVPVSVDVSGKVEIKNELPTGDAFKQVEKDTSAAHNKVYDVSGSNLTLNFSNLDEPGNYYYRVKQIKGSEPYVQYDDSEYIIKIGIWYENEDALVGNPLKKTMVIQKTKTGTYEPLSDDKLEKIEFTNKYPTVEEEETTVTRTIIYQMWDENGEEIFQRVKQPVKLKRKIVKDPDGNIVERGLWDIASPEAAYGAVDSPGKDGIYLIDSNQKTIPVWNIDRENPRDEIVRVYYAEDHSKTEIETTTIKRRIIYIKNGITSGTEQLKELVQEVHLKRTKVTDRSGNVTYTNWEIDTSKTRPEDWAAVVSPDPYDFDKIVNSGESGWTYDRAVVDKWPIEDLLKEWNSAGKDPVDAADEYVYYTPKNYEDREETKTIKRTITYTEYTKDGKKVAKTVVQTVKLKRTYRVDKQGYVVDKDGNRITDDNGNPIKEENYKSAWEIVSPKSDYGAVKSPDHKKKKAEGWTPDISKVPVWDIDLFDPKDEIVHVIYKPEKQPSEPTKSEEYKTIKRTITYTEYTKDGKKIFKTVVQEVRLVRTKEVDPETGTVLYGRWKIDSGDTGAVKSPEKKGWKADIPTVGEWLIDLDNPHDAIVHVIYTPVQVITPSGSPETGDATNLQIWLIIFAGAAVIAAAYALMIVADRRRRA